MLSQNKKSFLLAGSALTSLYCSRNFFKNLHQRQAAYGVLQKKRESDPADLTKTVFGDTKGVHYSGSLFKDASFHKSVEPLALMNTDFNGTPRLRNADGSYTELGALSAEPWPEFINKFSDNAELNITLIHRKAFGDTKTMRGLHALLEKQEFLFTHAILYVHDMHGNHAFYGFLPQSIVNDLLNRNVSHNYTAYKDLTITGTKQQTYALFEEIEKATKQPFTGIKFNCYTPIMTGLSKAREIGFKTPKDFDERLLVGVAQEQNGGAGMFYNKILGPVCEKAVRRTLGFQKR